MAAGGSRRVAPPAGPCPWLVYYHHKDHKHQTFYCNITKDGPVETHRKKMKALHHREVLLSSSLGWLVLYDDKTKLLSLCDSITLDAAITLPRLDKLWSPYNYTIDSCVLLSSSPEGTLRDLQVVIFFKSVSSLMSLRLDRDCPAWREIGYSHQLETLINEERHKTLTETGPLFFSGAISCGSKIYAKLELTGCCGYYYIWSIELVPEQEEVVLSRLRKPGVTACPCCIFLSESFGELFLLRTDTIELYKLKHESRVWERSKVVKDRAFFLCERYCLSCPALGCGGRVYYCTESECGYYTLEDDSKVDLRQLPDLPAASLPPVWMMPRAPLRPKDDDCNQDGNQEGSCSTTPIELLGETTTSGQDLNAGEKQALTNLPFDALVHVSKLLVPLDCMNFRAASRVCRSAIPPVKRSNPLSGSETSIPVPFLMSAVYKNDQHLYEFMDPRPNSGKCNSYLMKIPNPLENSAIRYAVGGRVIASKEGAIDLYNAFTGEVTGVTSSYHPRVGRNLTLFFITSFSGDQSVDTVVSVYFWGEEVSVSTIKPNEERWNANVVSKGKRGFYRTRSSPTRFEDAFYYLECDGSLGKLKLCQENEEKNWKVLTKPSNPCDKRPEYSFLVESDGDLLSVFVGSVGKWVSVYRLNRTEMVWEIVSSLGNHALYLSQASTISVRTSPDLGNRIYVPWVADSGIAFFSLETGEWHFSGGGDFSPDLYVKLRRNSCWIMPCPSPMDSIIREQCQL